MTKNDFYDVVVENYPLLENMINMVPADKLGWRPGPSFMSMGQLLCHVSDGLGGGLEMALAGKWPSMEEMEQGMKLENLPACSPAEAVDKLSNDKATLRQMLDGISEEEFTNKIVSVPWGWKAQLERIGIGFLQHLTNHKTQLFMYLKLLGLPVNTQTLYGG